MVKLKSEKTWDSLLSQSAMITYQETRKTAQRNFF